MELLWLAQTHYIVSRQLCTSVCILNGLASSFLGIDTTILRINDVRGRREKTQVVFHFVRMFRQEMKRGLSSFGKGCQFELLPSPSPIQAVIVPGNSSCISICKDLREVGRFDVYPIRSPTVPKGKERIRIILHAHNKEERFTHWSKHCCPHLKDL
ncbi:hypothetical protein QTG54_004038 [Skeletonema marinoi]|uniref:Uncharacterized protein n=1 Tax=Skeletonema marinoi TaxID=267567 RepID=A0AAD9DEY7_9STRA|nr:hypothetical protein QTG54_004038 [Skeletonema marinoi]